MTTSANLSRVFIALVIAWASMASPAAAENVGATPERTTNRGTEKSLGIKYNPATKSYYEYRVVYMHSRNLREGPNWAEAVEIAAESSFNGVQGRLAIVNSPEVHDFLLKNFRLTGQEVWIGLRFICESRQLTWVNGEELDKEDFAVWNLSQWYRNSDITCNSQTIPFMGVYYQPPPNFFRWQASGWAKRFSGMFIEYPTGKP